MDYNKLSEKRNFVKNNRNKLSKAILENYSDDFDVNFTHNSTAIEGNTLTLMETKLVLEDKLSIGSKELREIYEVVNHNKAWNYVKDKVTNKELLDEDKVKDIHNILMSEIMTGGIYRSVEVRITGANHTPPMPNDAYYQLKEFYNSLYNIGYNDFEIAAYTHAEFVKIHPFEDGNGRTSRIIMNYQLILNDYLPISIKKEDRFKYYEVLDEYAVSGNLNPFIQFIYELEDKELDFYIKAINESEKK